MSTEQSLVERADAYLKCRWTRICDLFADRPPSDFLDEGFAGLKELVRDCLTSTIKTYHYVLPTQVLCKAVQSSLDAHSLQVAWDSPGAFDARTVAHAVIVPFDQQNSRVLGGSPEPYVNNPLRCPAVIAQYRAQQRQKGDWDKLVAVLDAVEGNSDQAFTKALLDQILLEIYRLLSESEVVYPVPNRISLGKTYDLVERYLAERSGGDRIEAVATALLRTVGEEFALFDQVRRERINAPDTASGMLADIECRLEDRVVLLVEVKDRSLTLTQLDAKLDSARSKRISEILFIAEGGKAPSDREAIDERIGYEFASGQNVYVTSLLDFSLGVLILVGEQGRLLHKARRDLFLPSMSQNNALNHRQAHAFHGCHEFVQQPQGRVEFLAAVGHELDRSNSAIVHRMSWADLLKQA